MVLSIVHFFYKLLYGLRDANQGFEFKVRDTFVGEGYEAGLHSPCCYRHPRLPQAWAVHGDDYMGVGLRSQLLDFAQKLGKHLIVKVRGLLGPKKTDLKQIGLLNRLITWHDGHGGKPDSLTWEGDSRHVSILCSQLGVQPSSNGRATLADKTRFNKFHPLTGD